ncbi:hypothetical protein HND97_10535 [Vibrio cholerae]|nr:hypothetical protein HND97_10535 [Vibrio cholerae]
MDGITKQDLITSSTIKGIRAWDCCDFISQYGISQLACVDVGQHIAIGVKGF